jgi:hypothetical protein
VPERAPRPRRVDVHRAHRLDVRARDERLVAAAGEDDDTDGVVIA